MDLRDLVKLAGLANVELLNKLEPTAEVDEADGAGFDNASTRPEEEIFDDPMATMGSDADLSLRRYLKAKGDHVTVDEDLYPDLTVEDLNEAYATFKEGKYKSDAQRKAVHAAKAEESLEESKMADMMIAASEMSKEEFAKEYPGFAKDYEKLRKQQMADESTNEAKIGAPDYNPAKASAGGPGYASMPQQIKLAGDSIWDKEGTNPEMVTITDYEVFEEDGYVSVTVEHDGPMEVYTDSGFEKAVSDMIGMDVEFSEQGMQEDGRAHLEGASDIEEASARDEMDYELDAELGGRYGLPDDFGMFSKEGNEEVKMRVEDAAQLVIDGDYPDKEFGLNQLMKELESLSRDPNFKEATDTEVIEKATVGFSKMVAYEMESIEVDEPAVDENAFNQAAAAAARANKDSFEFNGKTYKTKMDKETAHKLDDDVDMLRKLAGLG